MGLMSKKIEQIIYDDGYKLPMAILPPPPYVNLPMLYTFIGLVIVIFGMMKSMMMKPKKSIMNLVSF